MVRYLYLLMKIKDGHDYQRGDTIWAHAPCTGWRTLKRIKIGQGENMINIQEILDTPIFEVYDFDYYIDYEVWDDQYSDEEDVEDDIEFHQIITLWDIWFNFDFTGGRKSFKLSEITEDFIKEMLEIIVSDDLILAEDVKFNYLVPIEKLRELINILKNNQEEVKKLW